MHRRCSLFCSTWPICSRFTWFILVQVSEWLSVRVQFEDPTIHINVVILFGYFSYYIIIESCVFSATFSTLCGWKYCSVYCSSVVDRCSVDKIEFCFIIFCIFLRKLVCYAFTLWLINQSRWNIINDVSSIQGHKIAFVPEKHRRIQREQIAMTINSLGALFCKTQTLQRNQQNLNYIRKFVK